MSSSIWVSPPKKSPYSLPRSVSYERRGFLYEKSWLFILFYFSLNSACASGVLTSSVVISSAAQDFCSLSAQVPSQVLRYLSQLSPVTSPTLNQASHLFSPDTQTRGITLNYIELSLNCRWITLNACNSMWKVLATHVHIELQAFNVIQRQFNENSTTIQCNSAC